MVCIKMDITIQEDIIDNMSKQIQEDIDQRIMFDLLIESGWTKIELPSKWLPTSGVELHEWREKNLTGHYKAHENVWIFEKSEDAVIFALRWA